MDFSIVALASAVLGLLLALVLVLTIPHVPDAEGAGYWALAFLPLGLGSALVGRGEALPALLLMLREPLLLSGYALLLIGLRQYLRLGQPWALAGAVVFSAMVLSALFVALYPSASARLGIRVSGIAVLMGAAVWSLQTVREPALRGVRYFLQGACGLIAALAVLRLLLLLAPEGASSWALPLVQLASMITTLSVLAVICGLVLLMTARMNEALLQLTIRDPLTGVFNRRGLDDAMSTVLSFAKRVGRPVAVLACDIDHFKRVNDTHGHAVGDAVLRQFAQGLSEAFPQADLVGRLGGEEFVVVLPGADADTALREAERVRTLVAGQVFVAGEGELRLTASIGVACAPTAQASWSELMARADAALYQAKSQGRNCCAVAADNSDAPSSAPARLVAEGHA